MRRRRIIVVAVAVAALVLGYFPLRATVFAPRFDVPSIAATLEYQEPNLLERAWALPVAKTFERRVVFQSNGSVCGPASLANILRSFGDPHATQDTVLAGTGKCGTGSVGHHSPIAAYLEAEDVALVLDVNGSFGPWLVATDRLFRAVDTVDSSSSKKRGLLVLE